MYTRTWITWKYIIVFFFLLSIVIILYRVFSDNYVVYYLKLCNGISPLYFFRHKTVCSDLHPKKRKSFAVKSRDFETDTKFEKPYSVPRTRHTIRKTMLTRARVRRKKIIMVNAEVTFPRRLNVVSHTYYTRRMCHLSDILLFARRTGAPRYYNQPFGPLTHLRARGRISPVTTYRVVVTVCTPHVCSEGTPSSRGLFSKSILPRETEHARDLRTGERRFHDEYRPTTRNETARVPRTGRTPNRPIYRIRAPDVPDSC